MLFFFLHTILLINIMKGCVLEKNFCISNYLLYLSSHTISLLSHCIKFTVNNIIRSFFNSLFNRTVSSKNKDLSFSTRQSSCVYLALEDLKQVIGVAFCRIYVFFLFVNTSLSIRIYSNDRGIFREHMYLFLNG